MITPEMAQIIDAIVALPEESRREILRLFEQDGKLKRFEARLKVDLGTIALNQ